MRRRPGYMRPSVLRTNGAPRPLASLAPAKRCHRFLKGFTAPAHRGGLFDAHCVTKRKKHDSRLPVAISCG